MSSVKPPSTLLRFNYGLLALSILLIVLATGYSAYSVTQMQRSIVWVAHTLDTQAAISDVLAENQRIETFGLRYLLSGRDDYLQAYVRSSFAVDDLVAKLSTRFADDGGQQSRLARLRAALQQRSDAMRRTIGDAQQFGLGSAARQVREGQGAELLERVQAIAAEMATAEAGQLRSRQQQLDRSIAQSATIVFLVDALALVSGLIAALAIRRSSRAWQESRIAAMQAAQSERISRERSAFLATVSHEIRTPMNAVFGFAELLARTPVTAQARGYLHAIRSNGDALLALINDILDLSRMEAGRLLLNPGPSNLRELADSVLAIFADQARDKALVVRCELDPGLPQLVQLDAQRMRQILVNLLSNAIKYTDQGRVELRIAYASADSQGGRELRIEVGDTGIGIGADKRDGLFEPFVRAVDDESADRRGGSGLGLAIVQRLVVLMGGTLGIDSEPGRGTRVCVRIPGVLPVASEQALPGQDADDEADFARLPASRILIVDDVAWNRRLLEATLADAGHQVITVDSGEHALREAERFQPDLVLLDLRMSGIGGVETARQLRRDRREATLRIVAVTAASASEHASDEPLFDAWLRKPVSRQALYSTLLRLLGGNRETPQPCPGTAAPPAEASEARQRALLRLREIVDHELPSLRATLDSGGLRRLAGELDQLAQQGAVAPLGGLARRLRGALARFDLGAIEALLRELPDLVHAEVDR